MRLKSFARIWKLTGYHRFFYSGLARRKSALSLIWLSMIGVGVVTFEWFLWGYSLTFSHTAGPFIGNMANVGFRNVLGAPSVGSSKIPDLLFAIYQMMFAVITPVLAIGAATDRGRMGPTLVFMFVWSTIVYVSFDTPPALSISFPQSY
jgi:Amt family ammonium transporter